MMKKGLFCILFFVFSLTISVQFVEAKSEGFKIVVEFNPMDEEKSKELIQHVITYFIEYAELQKKRKLTLEEYNMIAEMIVFLLILDDANCSRHIKITLRQGKQLQLPYSSTIFKDAVGINSDEDQDDEGNENS